MVPYLSTSHNGYIYLARYGDSNQSATIRFPELVVRTASIDHQGDFINLDYAGDI